MEAPTCTMHPPYGRGPRGNNPPHAAPQPAGSSGRNNLLQQHSKPFFYVQPPQSYPALQNLQWPLPMTYNPFFGFPRLGYGMPMMPPYLPNPYMELPGFVVPHTHLHLMDYRRLLNPQYYQTMAYHSRRLRYPHNSQSRETTTSEVQTEPLLTPQRISRPTGSNVEASSVPPVCNAEDSLPVPPSAVQKVDDSLEPSDSVSSSTSATPTNGSFVIQTEEVRIECCTTPVGLQLLHARESAAVSHGFSQDVVECSSVLQRGVLRDEALAAPVDQSEQALQVCPDILLIGAPGVGEKIPALEESRTQVDSGTASHEGTCGVPTKQSGETDQSVTSDFHLPFDAEYMHELRKMESSVWSMEDTLIPSPESVIQNMSSGSLLAAAEMELLLSEDEGLTTEVTETDPPGQDELEDPVSSVEALGDEMVSEADLDRSCDVSKESDVTDQTSEEALGPEGNNHGKETRSQEHQDTAFESLPSYLPSTRWFSDFNDVPHCTQVPVPPEKRYRTPSSPGLDVPTRRRKLDLEYKDSANVGRLKKYKLQGKTDHRSLLDYEYSLGRSFNENVGTPYVPRRDQLCFRCVAKHDTCTSAGARLTGHSLKRKAVPFQQKNDGAFPTCEACRSHSKRRLTRKCSNQDVFGPHRGLDTEGESSENSWCRPGQKWRATDVRKRPLMSKQNVAGHPAAMQPKNSMHSEPERPPAAWDRLRHCLHDNAIRDLDENCAVPISLQDQWRNQVYLMRRGQTERSWKAVMDPVASKTDARSQRFKPKRAQPHPQQPQPQGSCRKDARY